MRLFTAQIVGLALIIGALASCSSSPGGGSGGPCASSDDCAADEQCVDGTCIGTGSDAGADTGAPTCEPTRVCGDTCCATGETCDSTECCLPAELCGGSCCTGDRVCEGTVCRLVCPAEQVACVDSCCASGDVCLVGACETPGAACDDTTPCGEGEYCEPTLGRCLPRATSTETCEYRPPVGDFNPSEEWAWTGDDTVLSAHDQVMMAPMVANLTDDNGDGAIDERDVPDVIFNSFAGNTYYFDGVLRAISGDDGSRVFPTADQGYRTMPGAGVAIGELDATSPGPEIVTCSTKVGGSGCCDGTAGDLLILAATGELIRRVPTVRCGNTAPAIGDMDGDGVPEIVARYHAVHADGTTVFSLPGRITTGTGAAGDYAALADLDMDGDLELVGGNGAWHHDGTVLWERLDLPDGYPAIADVDMDGQPEVIVVSGGDHAIRALEGESGADLWGPVDINQGMERGTPNGGGPPTIADFDGDGLPEVAAAGAWGYVVFEGEDGAAKWFQPTQDASSRVTGSSVFDFDGDGAAEVVYNDEKFLRVYAGSDGTVLLEECATSGTLWEYPVVVDVDNDDDAEIIIMNNNYGGQRCTDGSASANGIRSLGDIAGNWVRTRKIWNQHTYHVTNVNEDGTIPRAETPNWTVPALNNFRQNVQPDGVLDAPDLVIVDVALDTILCVSSAPMLDLRVLNRGRAGAPAGIPVEVFDADPAGGATAIASATTTRPLLPGESELLRLALPLSIGPGGTLTVFISVNSGPARIETLNECREGNNTDSADLFCPDLT